MLGALRDPETVTLDREGSPEEDASRMRNDRLPLVDLGRPGELAERGPVGLRGQRLRLGVGGRPSWSAVLALAHVGQ